MIGGRWHGADTTRVTSKQKRMQQKQEGWKTMRGLSTASRNRPAGAQGVRSTQRADGRRTIHLEGCFARGADLVEVGVVERARNHVPVALPRARQVPVTQRPRLEPDRGGEQLPSSLVVLHRGDAVLGAVVHLVREGLYALVVANVPHLARAGVGQRMWEVSRGRGSRTLRSPILRELAVSERRYSCKSSVAYSERQSTPRKSHS